MKCLLRLPAAQSGETWIGRDGFYLCTFSCIALEISGTWGCLAATYLPLLYRYNMDFQPSQFTILAELLQCNLLFMCQV